MGDAETLELALKKGLASLEIDKLPLNVGKLLKALKLEITLENYLQSCGDKNVRGQPIEHVKSSITAPHVAAWNEALTLAKFTDKEQIKVDPRVAQAHALT